MAWGMFALLLVGCGDSTDSLDPRREANGENGIFHFVVDGDKPISQGKNDLRLTLTNASTHEPVEGAALMVMAHMPAMAHDMSHGTVTEDGEGQYTISPLLFSMAGHWEVNLTATFDTRKDETTIFYDIP